MSQAAVQRPPARFDASVVTGAKPAPFPGCVERCHPTLHEEAPAGGRWVHEIKFEGYGAQAHLRNGRPAIYTRRAYDWTLRFRTIADALAALPADDLILDGEAVVADSRGVPDLGLLHADLATGRKDRPLYYAFDLLYLDGFDLRGARLAERKRLLQSCWRTPPSASSFAEHLEGEGAQIQKRAGAMGVIVETPASPPNL
jgi:bifunctional non-homologous end joining protein LigD